MVENLMVARFHAFLSVKLWRIPGSAFEQLDNSKPRHSSPQRRWCGWCWALTPDRNLPMCTRCREYGYCCDEDGESNGVCQKKHWKVGGHRAECAALVASSSSQGTAVEASGGDVTGVAEGKGGEMDDEATADTSG